MPLQFFGDGKLTEVWIEDQRPDGSAALLVCRPTAAGGNTGSAQGPPVDLITSSAPDGNAYPLLRESGLVVRVQKVHVDTTSMPGGIQRYINSVFGRKATEVAEEGVRLVAITPATAREWGWLESDDETAAWQDDPVPSPGADVSEPRAASGGERSSTSPRSKSGR